MRLVLSTIVVFLFPAILFAQQTATTSDGKKVLLFKDGTWQYAENLTPDISENCEDYVGYIEDKSVLSGKVKVSINTVFIGETTDDIGFEVFMVQDVEHLLLDIQLVGEKICFEEGEMGVFTFEGNHDVKLQNIISKNCESQAQFLIKLKDKEALKRFSHHKLQKLRIFHKEGSVEQDVQEVASSSFQKTFQCMLGR